MVLEKALESPLDCKEFQQSILKEISPGISLEGMMLNRIDIKKQRHYFANKGSSSQGYDFSSGHVWM